MAVANVLFVHWHEAEGEERAAKLRAHGHDVALHWDRDAGSRFTRGVANALPDVVVVDLARLPSHGREVVDWLWGRKASRHIPVVFVEGDPDKTDRARQQFPAAVFTPWNRVRAAITRALKNPPAPAAAGSRARAGSSKSSPNSNATAGAGYSGTPLPKKLGIKPDGRAAIVRAPRGFSDTLGDLPAGAKVTSRLSGEFPVIVLFCRALTELRADWSRAVQHLAAGGSLWIGWPKKSSGKLTDLDGNVVRAFGLDQGLVDTKVCAIDELWSGLRFQRRRSR